MKGYEGIGAYPTVMKPASLVIETGFIDSRSRLHQAMKLITVFFCIYKKAERDFTTTLRANLNKCLCTLVLMKFT